MIETSRSLRPSWISLFLAAVSLASVAPTSPAQEPPKAAPSVEGSLRVGDTGPAVEGLQRLLNAKLSPSPELDVDGDFGEATRSALTRFQRANGLGPTGVADPSTRKALGPAPTGEPPVPSPESVNARMPAKKAADPLDGPPFTTSAAWAIADGKTGATLWGQLENKPLEMASTTKMMTALIVVRLAETDPQSASTKSSHSPPACRQATPGSTAGVHAGEKAHRPRACFSACSCPRATMRPTAFAEHFGPPVRRRNPSLESAHDSKRRPGLSRR